MGSSSPIFRVKINKNRFETTTQICIFMTPISWLNCFFPPDFNRCNPGTITGETTEECKHGILNWVRIPKIPWPREVICSNINWVWENHQPKMMESVGVKVRGSERCRCPMMSLANFQPFPPVDLQLGAKMPVFVRIFQNVMVSVIIPKKKHHVNHLSLIKMLVS